jgi:hypothetical protein
LSPHYPEEFHFYPTWSNLPRLANHWATVFYGTLTIYNSEISPTFVYTKVHYHFHKTIPEDTSWASWIQSIPSLTISFISVLMLSSRLRLDIHSGLFPSNLSIKMLYAVNLRSYACYMSHHPTLTTYSRSWALPEKLPVVQPLKNFTACYGTRKFITLCSQEPSAGPYPESDRSRPYHPILSL